MKFIFDEIWFFQLKLKETFMYNDFVHMYLYIYLIHIYFFFIIIIIIIFFFFFFFSI